MLSVHSSVVARSSDCQDLVLMLNEYTSGAIHSVEFITDGLHTAGSRLYTPGIHWRRALRSILVRKKERHKIGKQLTIKPKTESPRVNGMSTTQVMAALVADFVAFLMGFKALLRSLTNLS